MANHQRKLQVRDRGSREKSSVVSQKPSRGRLSEGRAVPNVSISSAQKRKEDENRS